MQQVLTVLISAQVGALIAFAAFAVLNAGGERGDERAFIEAGGEDVK